MEEIRFVVDALIYSMDRSRSIKTYLCDYLRINHLDLVRDMNNFFVRVEYIITKQTIRQTLGKSKRILYLPAGMKKDLCIVCQHPYKTNQIIRVLPCTHTFHTKCIDKWFMNGNISCPICAKELFDTTKLQIPTHPNTLQYVFDVLDIEFIYE